MGIALGLGMLLGVRAVSGGSPSILLPLLIVGIAMILLWSKEPRILLVLMLGGCVTGAFIGFWRYRPVSESSIHLSEPPYEGKLVADPRTAGRWESARVVLDQGEGGLQWTVFMPAGTDVGRGDVIRFDGEFSDDPDLFFASSVTITRRAGGFEPLRQRLREQINRRVRRHVPGSPGTLALGLLTGDDSAFTRMERDQVRRAGLSHITAVSGWNVTVVVMTTAFILRALNLHHRRWFVVQVVAILGFVWLVGIQPPILRAALMGIAALCAFQIGRPAHLLTLLTLSAAAMATWSPEILGSLSFQLSVLSMIGIALAAPLVERLEGAARVVGAAVLVPVAAAVMTAPLIAAMAGTFSLATVPANIAAAPLVTYGGYAAGLAALAADVPLLSTVLGSLVWLICGAVLAIAGVSAVLPGFHWTFTPLASSTVVSLYIILGIIVSPLIPEARAVLRRGSRWLEASPARVAFACLSCASVLGFALALS